MPSPTEEGRARQAMPQHAAATRENAYQLYKRGKLITEVAVEIKVPRVTIQRWKKAGKWDDRVKVEKFGDKPKGETPGEDLTFEEKQERYKEKMAVQALRLPEIMSRMDDEDVVRNAPKLKDMDGMARKALNLEEARPAAIINVALLSRPLQPLEALIEGQDTPALTEHADDSPATVEAELVEPCAEQS
jgi:hypothetical protein